MTKNFPYLINPVVLAALILTAINDHYLKQAYANFLTGKISDFAGLFFFPLFLNALFEFVKSPAGQHRFLNKKQIVTFIVLTDVLFILFKYTALREQLMNLLPLHIVPDYSDLLALSVNWGTYYLAKKYFAKAASA